MGSRRLPRRRSRGSRRRKLQRRSPSVGRIPPVLHRTSPARLAATADETPQAPKPISSRRITVSDMGWRSQYAPRGSHPPATGGHTASTSPSTKRVAARSLGGTNTPFGTHEFDRCWWHAKRSENGISGRVVSFIQYQFPIAIVRGAATAQIDTDQKIVLTARDRPLGSDDLTHSAESAEQDAEARRAWLGIQAQRCLLGALSQ
jgi:hypothetical protein